MRDFAMWLTRSASLSEPLFGWSANWRKRALSSAPGKADAEAKDQVRTAVAHERAVWEDEKVQVIKRERDNFEDELARTSRRLQDAVEYERTQLKQSQQQVADLRHEVEDVRQENRSLHKEATEAHIIARQACDKERKAELNEQKDKLTLEHQKIVYDLEDKMRSLQDQLGLVTVESQNATTRNADLESRVVQHEKTVLIEINEACRLIGRLINLNMNKLKKRKTNESVNTTQEAISVTTDGLVNLKACVAELQTYVCGLKETIDAEKLKHHQLRERYEISTRGIRDELNIEKQREIEDVKDKLNQQHMKEINKLQEALVDDEAQEELHEKRKEIADLKAQMSAYKRDTANRLAMQFDTQVKEEVEKRIKSDNLVTRQNLLEVQKEKMKLENELEAVKAEGTESESALQLLRHLQDRVNLLRDENARLRCTLNASQLY